MQHLNFRIRNEQKQQRPSVARTQLTYCDILHTIRALLFLNDLIFMSNMFMSTSDHTRFILEIYVVLLSL